MPPASKVVVRLTGDRRDALGQLLRTGSHPAAMRRRAAILLRADADVRLLERPRNVEAPGFQPGELRLAPIGLAPAPVDSKPQRLKACRVGRSHSPGWKPGASTVAPKSVTKIAHVANAPSRG